MWGSCLNFWIKPTRKQNYETNKETWALDITDVMNYCQFLGIMILWFYKKKKSLPFSYMYWKLLGFASK